MIKITALNYKVRPESLERFHNLTEHAESQMFDWELAMGNTNTLGSGYIDKPFIEPQEFKESDYVITPRRLRVRLEDIIYYTENMENVVDLSITTPTGIVTFSIKESIEEIDAFFDN